MTISTLSRNVLATTHEIQRPLWHLASETSAAQVCDFDELLCAFIFRCLRDDSSLESLQNDIEKLERGDNLDQGQKSDLGRLRHQRDDALQNHLEQCLEAVLTVANDESIRSLLSEYLRSFSGVETNRYAPYVNLCNKALSLLRTTNLPLRSPTAPDLQYRRLDPSVLKSQTGADRVHRTPDVGKAGDSVVKSLGTQLEQSPDKGAEPEFDAFLGFEEFKAIGSPSEEARAAVESAFTTTARRVRVRPQDSEMDEVQLSPSTSPSPNVSATPPATSSRSSKRKLEATNSVTSSKKLRLGVKNGVALRKESSNEKNFDGRVQCAAYALEMLSQNPGIQHTINLLHIDDCLFIWYYDREGIVRSNGVSFIADFPRALVLMALFQRFTVEDWGRCKTFNCPPNTPSFTVSLNDPLLENKYNPHDFLALEIKCSDEDYLAPPPRCLGGRATRVLPCEPKLKDNSRVLESLVVKISHPEVRRAHEGKTMKGIRNIAAKYDASMTDHLPGLLCYADVRGTDTGRVRSLVGKPGNGYQIMRVVVMKKLAKVTTLDATDFLRAWLDAVTCHAFLWKHGIEHGDPSLYNVMCHPETRRGVLTDFDLSILQWEERVPGCDRTGTVPFMAFELLDDAYWNGDIVRYYHHEMEAFIWCLPFMCLGGFVGDSVRHEVISDWVKATPSQCLGKKAGFVKKIRQYSSHVPLSFAACYQLALQTKSWRDPKSSPMLGLEDAFISPLIERLETHRPHFDGLDDSMKSELRQIFLADSQPPALQVKAPELKDRMNGRQDSRPRSTPPIPPT
ncbi:hypothetical protein PC9H_011335 [Pleurotus ostreatus]|uniref:Fungal-type protein kinase domain-containing protein n=1 Tax=Pleurotus ostreatus TaxID=5322 RepID=A0A8H6ZNC5_PLEOS|nr:uncharacterized protein PC9H_011335 [Pleurotus ostreatus]KAF7420817.1 hypothetical protein PC9H_011335 [Pleurotus ostreatus]